MRSPYRLELPRPRAWPPPRDRAGAAELLEFSRRFDPIGHFCHVVLALLFVAALPVATSPKEFAMIGLVVCLLARAWHLWRCFTPLVHDPLLWLLAAWAGWSALSLSWSSDARQGFNELHSMRMLILPLLLWPLMQRPQWLIAALLAGVLAVNAVQLAQFMHWLGLSPGHNDRLTGFLHPIHTGAFCAAAMGWHLSASLHARRWLRGASIAGLLIAGAGLIGSGSRGPWIAAAVALALGWIIILARRPEARRAALLLAVAGVLAAALAWPLMHAFVASRIDPAAAALREARDQPVSANPDRLRFTWWRWSWQIFLDAPVRGVGGGGFRDAAMRLPDYRRAIEQNPALAGEIVAAHPHSTWLVALAEQGVIGGAVLLAILIPAAVRCWRDPPDHPWADGSLIALLTWAISAVFDCAHFNGNMLALLMVIIAVTLPQRPAIMPR